MSELPEDIYLDAARAGIKVGYHTLTAKGIESFAAGTARSASHRATVESARAAGYAAAVQQVREIHRQVVDSSWPEPGHCLECVDAGGDAMDYRPYPCSTIAALDETGAQG